MPNANMYIAKADGVGRLAFNVEYPTQQIDTQALPDSGRLMYIPTPTAEVPMIAFIELYDVLHSIIYKPVNETLNSSKTSIKGNTSVLKKINHVDNEVPGTIQFIDISYELTYNEFIFEYQINNTQMQTTFVYSNSANTNNKLHTLCQTIRQVIDRRLSILDKQEQQKISDNRSDTVIYKTVLATLIATILSNNFTSILNSAYELIVSFTLYVPYILCIL